MEFFFRCYVSVATVDNCIYAMGGFDGDHRQNSVERFDHRRNQVRFLYFWYLCIMKKKCVYSVKLIKILCVSYTYVI